MYVLVQLWHGILYTHSPVWPTVRLSLGWTGRFLSVLWVSRLCFSYIFDQRHMTVFWSRAERQRHVTITNVTILYSFLPPVMWYECNYRSQCDLMNVYKHYSFLVYILHGLAYHTCMSVCRLWSCLNQWLIVSAQHKATVVDHLKLCGLPDNNRCACKEVQMMSHIVSDCPLVIWSPVTPTIYIQLTWLQSIIG